MRVFVANVSRTGALAPATERRSAISPDVLKESALISTFIGPWITIGNSGQRLVAYSDAPVGR